MKVSPAKTRGPIAAFRDFKKPPSEELLSTNVEPQDLVLLPDSGGEISEVYFHYPALRAAEKSELFERSARAVISELAAQLTGQPTIYVALEAAETPDFGDGEVVPLSVDGMGYIWARDGATAAIDSEGNPTLILSARKARGKVLPVSDQGFDQLAKAHPDLKLDWQPNVDIEDGQRVANSRHTFLSEGAVKRTSIAMQVIAKRAGTLEAQQAAFEKERGIEVSPIGAFDLARSQEYAVWKDYLKAGREIVDNLETPEEKREALLKFRENAMPEYNKRLTGPPENKDLAALVGTDKMPYQEMWRELAIEHLEGAYGDLVIIGADNKGTVVREASPADHIDMVITPVDDETVIVGSSRLTLDLLAELSPEERELYNQRISAAVGEDGDHLATYESSLTWNTTGKFTSDHLSHILLKKGLMDHQDQTAKDLEELGYNVHRVPCFVEVASGLPYLTYNNVLMENGPDKKTVHLPHYGLDVLDKAASETYEKLGFEVDTVGEKPIEFEGREVYPMLRLTKSRGALRCLSQVVARHDH